ncbi:MAG TPA: penicillin-binding protein 2 [Caulobacteraceae bacterium]|jgi:cell division protein FtsI (penicillin-binding protein 3)
MSLGDALAGPFTPIGRWVSRRMWWMEHAFERSRSSDRMVDDTRLRIFFVLALFGMGFITLGLGATRAALFSPFGHGAEVSEPQPNARADLTDRNGQLMAVDLPRWGLYLDPHEMVRKDLVRAALVAAVPGLSADKLDKALAGEHRAYLIGGLSPDLKDQVHDLGLPGVTFEEEVGRSYPLGDLAAHLIGFASKDGEGLAGAERAFNPQIRADGGKDPVALAVDLRVQGALEDELDQAGADMQAAGGVGIVVNVRTGEILGMASYPSFDPNAPTAGDPRNLVNHAAATVYEPGSVMKVFTLAMGIDAGVATPDTLFNVGAPLQIGDRTVHDYDTGEGELTLAQVFTHSSNIGAAKLGLMAGPDRMDHYFRAFGLFNAAPSELAESTRPLLQKTLSPNVIASMSFGHSISVSPLAIATGMSAILDGGIYRPLTLKRLAPGQAPATGVRVIQESTSRTMLDLMRLNVTTGTGQKADIPGLRVGGKTGTATKLVNGHYVEGRNALNLASFAAIFPTDAPFDADRYLVLIMLDEPKPTKADSGVTTGALTSAPVAGRVIERIAPFLGVRRVMIAADMAPKPAADLSKLGANEQ